jgi:hypothetical protein
MHYKTEFVIFLWLFLNKQKNSKKVVRGASIITQLLNSMAY